MCVVCVFVCLCVSVCVCVCVYVCVCVGGGADLHRIAGEAHSKGRIAGMVVCGASNCGSFCAQTQR
jgi:hypothetical protein